jgi:hypothetical protein
VSEELPADLLGRLRPIPTYRDHPATSPRDIEGVDPRDPEGEPRSIDITATKAPVLLLFLSSTCLGCRDLWEGMDELRRALPDRLRVIVVTRGPDWEDPAAIVGLAQPSTEVVMSERAYDDYRVGGPPFLVVVDAERVRTEGVAWGVAETSRAVRVAVAG